MPIGAQPEIEQNPQSITMYIFWLVVGARHFSPRRGMRARCSKRKRKDVLILTSRPWTGSFGAQLPKRNMKRGLSMLLKNKRRPQCLCITLRPGLSSWMFNISLFQALWPVLTRFLRTQKNNNDFCCLPSTLALLCQLVWFNVSWPIKYFVSCLKAKCVPRKYETSG